MPASVFDVYVRNNRGEVEVIRSTAANPDDAIHKLRIKGEFIPEKDDLIVRCVEVDCPAGRK